jgi:putative FmdB family regulatory protein
MYSMPTYEYECKACGERLDAFQKMSDDPLVDCPSCKKPELKRLVSAAAFQLKGNGWYQTDFKNSGKKEPAKDNTAKDGSADAKTGEGASKETETKATATPCGGECACH